MEPLLPTRHLLDQAYHAFNARDLDTVLALMSPDVDWPNGMQGGYVHGTAAVRDYWTWQWSAFDPHVAPTGYELLPDGRVAVTVQQTVRDLDGTILLDGPVRHVYRVQDGLIHHMEIQHPG